MTEAALNTKEWVEQHLDPQLEALIFSARKTGFAEAMNEVMKLLIVVARNDDAKAIFKLLAKGFDEIQTKGPTNA